jgi:uncharacterized damage-inducible protein DinB
MNANDVLKYGHQEVLKAIDKIPEAEWETEGVCGYWTVKDVVAHLASFEQILIEMIGMAQGQEPGPTLHQRMEQGEEFNDNQVAQYRDQTPKRVLAEYTRAFEKSSRLVGEISAETLRQPGTIPAYGPEYAIDDLLVYQYYGHKREHSAQINAFDDRLGQ